MSGEHVWSDCDIGGYTSSLSIVPSLINMDSNRSPNSIVTYDEDDIVSISDNVDNYGITILQQEMTKRMSNLSANCLDEFQLDLFHTLKASNDPLELYDRVLGLTNAIKILNKSMAPAVL